MGVLRSVTGSVARTTAMVSSTITKRSPSARDVTVAAGILLLALLLAC